MRLPRWLEPGRWDFVARQSAHPKGLLGRIVARVMGRETSPENRKAVELLHLEPGHDVLEVGFGNGTALTRVLEATHPTGEVAGTERSRVMVRRAVRRLTGRCWSPPAHGATWESWRVPADLRLVSNGDPLPFWSGSFDRVFTVNTLYFWDDPVEQLREMARVLRPDGQLLLGFAWDPELASRYSAAVYRFRSPAEVETLVEAADLVPVGVVSDSLPGKDFHWMTARPRRPPDRVDS